MRNLYWKAARFLAVFITSDKDRFLVSLGMTESEGLGITILG